MAEVSILWFDECMVRYSNCNFFSATDKAPFLYNHNTENVSKPGQVCEAIERNNGQLDIWGRWTNQ